MPKKFVIILCAICSFFLMGGHWAVLQTVAWANMIRTYSQDAALNVAIEKTFSGEHPCSLCAKISEAKKQESKSEHTAPESAGKLLGILSMIFLFPIPRRKLLGMFESFFTAFQRAFAPLTPPPLR
ncbi:hypothetical protein QPK87_30280 [Kamptonema cortianum]|nr:hypothetical protein [Kamptonema cortianum]